jgi:predicted CXXCH cytochrome family protein
MIPSLRKLPPIVLIAILLLCSHLPGPIAVRAAPSSSPHLEDPDRACAQCHQAIYTRYRQTPKSKGSGLALEALSLGAFHHQPSGIDYRVFLRDGSPWMSFSRPTSPELAGERHLQYFIGSGIHGRTYLYQQQDQWFELPINFYTRRAAWDMAPAFDDATTMPAVLPADPNCLHCHATQVQPSLPTARNRFATVPFLQGGIGCSACHGDPTQHLAHAGHAPILNPAKLSAARRDSACLQCHLEGDAVVYRPGRSLAQFQAGDDLSDIALFFVRASAQGGGGRAASQYEALLRSACKRAVGDRLTCTTCHDPHSTPAPAEAVQYFRARCLACHTNPALAATHHPEQPDCASCHMPTRATTDISHEQTTDHDIERIPRNLPAARRTQGERLLPVNASQATDREYGLAYAQLALHGDRAAQQKSLALLTRAASSGANDPTLEVQLGYMLQLEGKFDPARAAYSTALNANPFEPTALANLAVLDASSGQVAEAVRLLDTLVKADPSQTAAGLNLAFILCRLGHAPQALEVAHRLEPFNPDNPQLRIFLARGEYGGQNCRLHP